MLQAWPEKLSACEAGAVLAPAVRPAAKMVKSAECRA
jgi:hypothetical protein